MLAEPPILSLLLSFAAFLSIVTANIVSLHAVATIVRARPRGEMNRLNYVSQMAWVLKLVMSFLTISVATNLLWGAFVYRVGAVSGFRSSVFFSLENYTALGLTRVQVDEQWRYLAPLISLSGVFCLGWSTAILVNLFNHLYSHRS